MLCQIEGSAGIEDLDYMTNESATVATVRGFLKSLYTRACVRGICGNPSNYRNRRK